MANNTHKFGDVQVPNITNIHWQCESTLQHFSISDVIHVTHCHYDPDKFGHISPISRQACANC